MRKNSIKKYISMILIVLLGIYSVQGIFNFGQNISQAANVGYSTDINGIDESRYPGYKELIKKLQDNKDYSKWTIKLYYTGIDWNTAISGEYQGHGGSPKSLFQPGTYGGASYGGDWYCSICEKRKYDNGSWCCASEAAIAYMMDPRNSLNASDIFQFQDLSYDGTIGYAGIQAMVSGTFLNTEILINAILTVGQTKNINPLFIAARILQEQGNNASILSSGEGYNGEYVGYYNLFNYGATGNGEEVIINGLKYAVSKGWTTPEASIIGGISLIADNYIANNQNTCYFQKFNVISRNSAGQFYTNQYMQNILAAQTEGVKIRQAYSALSKLNGDYTFIIPVYENMPKSAAPRPNATDYEKPNNKLREEGSSLILEPKTTISDIKNAGYNVTSATKNGTDVMNSSVLGTGTIVVTDKGTFTVVKMGDVSGDGEVNAIDASRILRYSIGQYSLGNEYLKAGDLSNNGEVNAISASRILRYSVGQFSISI